MVLVEPYVAAGDDAWETHHTTAEVWVLIVAPRHLAQHALDHVRGNKGLWRLALNTLPWLEKSGRVGAKELKDPTSAQKAYSDTIAVV